MKQTSFEFEIRASTMDGDSLAKMLQDALRPLQGVKSVVVDGKVPFFTAKVLSEFPDATAAERLHRKLMTQLIKMRDISIIRTRSNLTEIFG